MKKWTEKDIQYLKDKAGEITTKSMARQLRRNCGSIRAKASLLGLQLTKDCTEYLTLTEISKALNVQKSSLSRTWQHKGLKVRKLDKRKLVSYDDLIDFLGRNQDLFSTIGADTSILADASWLQEKRKKDLINNYKTNVARWSKSEVAMYNTLLNMGKTYREIGEKIGKSEMAVKQYGVYQRKLKKALQGERNNV